MKSLLEVEDVISRPISTINPDYYRSQGIEAIDVIIAFDLNFTLGNALKYILRAGRKSYGSEDLQKAIWYLQKEIDRTQ